MKKLTPYLVLMICIALVPFSATTAREAEGDSKAVNQLWKKLNEKKLKLRSESALIVDRFDNPIYGKAINTPLPIASITKLMTAIVILDSKLPLDEKIKITKADRDMIKLTGSRLQYGARLPRKQLLQLALMSSENRAAAALGRTYPGGTRAFVRAMNAKAKSLNMHHSHFADPAGLKVANKASPNDLVKLIRAARNYPEIHEATTQKSMTVYPYKKKGPLKYANTNRLLKNKKWSIELSKTGYINEAGRCLVMQADIAGQPVVIVLLNSFGKLTPFGDANRIKKWIENGVKQQG